MKDDDDEENFESLIYGQREPDQDAKHRFGQPRGDKDRRGKTKHIPVQDDTKLEDGDTNQLSHGVCICLKRCFPPDMKMSVCMVSLKILFHFLGV
jgi:hypothetical protein